MHEEGPCQRASQALQCRSDYRDTAGEDNIYNHDDDGDGDDGDGAEW